MCDFCKSNKLLRVLAVREAKARVTDSQGFVLAMDMTDIEKPKLKTFFWGVKDDPDLGNALTADISYCPMCGRKLKEETYECADEDALNTIYMSYYPDGSFEVYSDDDPDGIRVEFDNAAKDWSLPKKYLEAYNDFLKKKFGPHEDLL